MLCPMPTLSIEICGAFVKKKEENIIYYKQFKKKKKVVKRFIRVSEKNYECKTPILRTTYIICRCKYQDLQRTSSQKFLMRHQM